MKTKADNEGCPDAPGGEAPPAASRQTRRFYQFALRELFLLLALVAVLLGLVAPKIHVIFESRRVQETARRQAAAEADLDAAVLSVPVRNEATMAAGGLPVGRMPCEAITRERCGFPVLAA